MKIFDRLNGLKSEIEGLRKKIQDLKDTKKTYMDSPPPVSEILQKINDQINAGMTRSERAVNELLMPNIKPDLFVNMDSDGDILSRWLLFALSDQIKKGIAERFNGLAFTPGEPMAKRAQWLINTDTKIREFEIQEEKLIVSAEDAGIEILRRDDVSPVVVLEFE